MKHFFLIIVAALTLGLADCAQLFAQADVKVTIKGGINNASVKHQMEEQASNLLTAMNESLFENKKIKETMTFHMMDKALIKTVQTLWENSAMSCPVSEISEVAVEVSGQGYQVRNIPILLLDAADGDEEDQDLVLCFDNMGNLNNLHFALEKHNYSNVIVSGIEVEDLVRRLVILDFVENFRTAYNRKDLAYLKQVYSDDALIITGTTLKPKDKNKDTGLMNSLGASQIKYQIQTKEEYINKLKKIFSKNAFLNLVFDDVTVMKHPKKENIYGVTLKQHWNSSTYSDVGWLFLMINFEDALNPSIEVRTWQPEEFNGQKLRRDEVFSLDNFKV